MALKNASLTKWKKHIIIATKIRRIAVGRKAVFRLRQNGRPHAQEDENLFQGYRLVREAIGRLIKRGYRRMKRKFWAATLCGALCALWALTGCQENETLLRGVEKADLFTSPVSSFMSRIDEAERIEEVFRYFDSVDFVQVADGEKQKYFENLKADEGANLLKAVIIDAYVADAESISLFVYPNGYVSATQGEDVYYAESGSVDYEGLLAAVERIESEERAAAQ